MSELPTDLKEDLEEFEQSLKKLEEKIQPLLDIPKAELTANMSEADIGKLYLVLAYTMNSLFFGVDPLEHEVKSELERVKKYMAKLKKMTEDQAAATMKVDSAAAGRFVSHALGATSKEGKETKETKEGDKKKKKNSKHKLADKVDSKSKKNKKS